MLNILANHVKAVNVDYDAAINKAREDALSALVDQLNKEHEDKLTRAFEKHYARKDNRLLNTREIAHFLKITYKSAISLMSGESTVIDCYNEDSLRETVTFENDAIKYAREHSRRANEKRKTL